MSFWFRIYDEALNDPKIQRLAPHLFKAWFNLLCLANKAGDGRLPAMGDIAYALRLSDTDAQCIVDELILSGLLDIAPDKSISPHNWKSRQAPSDKSKARTKRWRDGKKSAVTVCDGNGDRHGDGAVTVCDGNGDRHGDDVVTGGDSHGDGLDKNRQDSDSDILVPSVGGTARAKAMELGLRMGFGKGKGSTLTKRAEGLGLDVAEITRETEAANPKNHSAYFTQICVNRMRDLYPLIPENLVRDALWGKSPNAYTQVMAAILEATQ
jgi:hypothetical protein